VADEESWFCYMVRCKDGSLYVGVATDLASRVKEHNWGVGAKFTSTRRPVALIWWQEFPNQKAARGRESELKGWRREKKLNLVREFAEARTLQPQKTRLQGESPKAGDSGESSNG
jgi:predicted GIY-YIG superfamily endonuclease